MIKTYTFETSDNIIDNDPTSFTKFEFTVKEEFLNICPNPEKHTPHNLFAKHNMQKYLHSEFGPATKLIEGFGGKDRVRMSSKQYAKDKGIPGYEDGVAHFGEYWIDGKRVEPEVEKVMIKEYVEHLKKNL